MFADTESWRKKFTRISCFDIYKENTIKNKCVKLWCKWQCKLQHNRALLLLPQEHKAGGTTFGQRSKATGKLDLEGSHQRSSTQQLAFLMGRPPPSEGSSVWLTMTVLSMPNYAFSEEFFSNIRSEPPLAQLGAYLTSKVFKPCPSSKDVTKPSTCWKTSQCSFPGCFSGFFPAFSL